MADHIADRVYERMHEATTDSEGTRSALDGVVRSGLAGVVRCAFVFRHASDDPVALAQRLKDEIDLLVSDAYRSTTQGEG